MNTEQLSKLEEQLVSLTPAIIEDLLASYRNDSAITSRYDTLFLRPMAEQAVISFRNVLVGAYQHASPGLVGYELVWLTRIFEARQISANRVHIFLHIFKERLRLALPQEESEPIIKFLKRVEEDYNERELIRKFNLGASDGNIGSN